MGWFAKSFSCQTQPMCCVEVRVRVGVFTKALIHIVLIFSIYILLLLLVTNTVAVKYVFGTAELNIVWSINFMVNKIN